MNLYTNIQEMKDLVNFARTFEKTQRLKKINQDNNNQLRRGFAVNKDLNKGYKLKFDDLIFIRPRGDFNKYNDIDKLIGKKLVKRIKKGQHINKKDSKNNFELYTQSK